MCFESNRRCKIKEMTRNEEKWLSDVEIREKQRVCVCACVHAYVYVCICVKARKRVYDAKSSLCERMLM